jgi:hypothetical protein
VIVGLHAGSIRILALVALLAPGIAPVALAAWPSNPATNVALCTATGDQWWSAIVPDGSGGAIVTWTDARGGTATDIYAQRISANGAYLWAYNGQVVCNAPGVQDRPLLVTDGAGGAIVTWRDSRGGGTGDVYAQRISGSGVVQWTANGVPICTLEGDQVSEAMMADGAGGAFLVWADQRNILYSSYSIYAQRISSSGAAQWAANGVALSTTGSNGSVVIAPDGASGAVVAWISSRYSLDVYAQRVSGTGAVQWATETPVCTAAERQLHPAIVADGSGGAIIAWEDQRADVYGDLYAQRISASGAPQWTGDGVALCTLTGAQDYPALVPSGTNGAIVVWGDSRGTSAIYGQRLASDGSTQWTASGLILCTASGNEYSPCIAADGADGVLLAWMDTRSGEDIYAQHLTSAGTAQWTANGVPVSTAPGSQLYPVFATDGAGGMIAAWRDLRGSSQDVYAQRVDQWGYLNAQPAITGARDTPADEGAHVTVSWTASANDTGTTNPIGDYRVWRRAPSSGTWEPVGTLAAQRLAGYSLSVPTTTDSTGGGNPRTTFRVEARGLLPGQSWLSDSLAGYSVDNLAPAPPAPFTGEYVAGVTRLHWPPSPAADFATFRIHRGPDESFVPGPSNLVTTQADTGYVDTFGSPALYKLCAVDVHGNLSPYVLLQYSRPVDVPGAALPHELALSAPAPNPASGSCTMRLALPREARVALAVFDQQGRRVRTLLAGTLPAGEHPVTWDGRDDRGRGVASGIYFVRGEAEGRTLNRRIVAIR